MNYRRTGLLATTTNTLSRAHTHARTHARTGLARADGEGDGPAASGTSTPPQAFMDLDGWTLRRSVDRCWRPGCWPGFRFFFSATTWPSTSVAAATP